MRDEDAVDNPAVIMHDEDACKITYGADRVKRGVVPTTGPRRVVSSAA
jgi:hypothetical protein